MNSKMSQSQIKKIENLRLLWQDFKNNFDTVQMQNLIEKKEVVDKNWQGYKSAILEGELTLDLYTNRKPEDYLCNFLERDSRDVYGASRPGNANNFMIKLNENGNYTFYRDLSSGESENNNTKEDAEELFEEEIKPLFFELISTADPKDLVKTISGSNYIAKNILLKVLALEGSADFIYIYSGDNIDLLFSELFEDHEVIDDQFQKNHEIRSELNSILNINTDDSIESILLSKFMWEYLNTKSIADDATPNVVLYGAPGTGKTYSVKRDLRFLCKGDYSRVEFIQFHPSFTYEDFIEGIKPKGLDSQGNIKFEVVNGVFKKFCMKASEHPDKSYYFVVDEINRANLSAVFGETLSLLEADYRHDCTKNNSETKNCLLKTQYSTLIESLDEQKKKELAYKIIDNEVYFGVPKNVYFIGMMNDVDKSIDAFDLALRRRFKWIRKDCDYDVILEETKYRNGKDFDNIDEYVKCARALNDYISQELLLGKSYEFGHSFFMKMSGIAKNTIISEPHLKTLFDSHLRPTLKEYLRAFYPENDIEGKNGKLALALEKFQSKLSDKKSNSDIGSDK